MIAIKGTAILLIGSTIVLTVAGNLLIKAGMVEVGVLPDDLSEYPGFLFQALTNLKVILAMSLAFLAAVSWMGAISMTDISLAYPFMSLAVVLVLLLSGILFEEAVPLNRWIGVVIVCIGLIVASRS